MKITVITPSYNQASFLAQTVDSVVTQTGDFSIEYFILDGGSTDGSVDLIKKYAKKYKDDPRIKIIWRSGPDGGQVNALNYGLAQATGDIIAYINSDDYYLPQTFSLIVNYFRTNPQKSWLVGNCKVSDPRLAWTFFLKHLWPIHIFPNALLVFNTINQPSVFLKKKLVKKVGEFDTKLHLAFDYDYWLRCNKVGTPGRIFHPLSYFRVHPTSKSNLQYVKQFDEDWLVFLKQNPSEFFFIIHALARNFVKFIYSFLK